MNYIDLLRIRSTVSHGKASVGSMALRPLRPRREMPDTGGASLRDGGMVVGAPISASGTASDDASLARHSTWVDVGTVSEGLCSLSRPHFFRGVATIVGVWS